MERYTKSEISAACPNCLRPESSSHLCCCLDPQRTKLFEEDIQELENWLLKEGHTDPEIAYWVPKFLLLRGTSSLSNLTSSSPALRILAEEQDLIGWRCFTEGKISRQFLAIQTLHLGNSTFSISPLTWTRQFITRILRISHSQWLFRNLCAHDKQGGLRLLHETSNAEAAIKSLLQTDPFLLPEESRFLLEVDAGALGHASLDHKQYWISAMRAALRGSRLRKAASNFPTGRLSEHQRIQKLWTQIRVERELPNPQDSKKVGFPRSAR